jgi:hypothetical protein
MTCTYGLLCRGKCRGTRQAAGEKAGGKACLETQQLREAEREQKAGQRDHDCQREVPGPILAQHAEETRSGLQTDREDEQHEPDGLDRGIEFVAEVAEDQADKQHAGDRSDFESSDFRLADQIAESQHRKEHSDRVVSQELLENCPHRAPLLNRVSDSSLRPYLRGRILMEDAKIDIEGVEPFVAAEMMEVAGIVHAMKRSDLLAMDRI